MKNIENANNDTVQKSETTIQADNINPHILWKQILGLSISSIIISFLLGIFGGIFVVLTGIFTFIDAWKAGIYKKKKIKSFLNNSPMAWGIGIEFLLIVVYPIYLIKRNKLKTKKCNNIFWILTIVFGGITILLSLYEIIIKIIAYST